WPPVSRTRSRGQRAHQRTGPREAWRDHRDQDTDLAPDGNRVSPLAARRADSARHHPAVRVHLQRHRSLPGRAPSGHRCQPVLRLLHGRHRERNARVPVDRRQRLLGDRDRHHHGRLSGRARRLLVALTMVALAGASFAAEIPLAERRSGYELMSGETRAMQDDDTANPGMLGVLEGGALWARKTGAAGRACADCHGEARASMKGVATRHPAYDATLKRPVNLEQRINLCRTERQQAPALAYESRELLALTAYV